MLRPGDPSNYKRKMAKKFDWGSGSQLYLQQQAEKGRSEDDLCDRFQSLLSEGVSAFTKKVFGAIMERLERSPPVCQEARLIDPTDKLENPHRYWITDKSPRNLMLKIVKQDPFPKLEQYPFQELGKIPRFEFAEMSDKYEKMEQEMIKIYSQFPTDPVLDLEKVPGGTCAVLRLWSDQLQEPASPNGNKEPTPVFKRIRILEGPGERKVFRVEFIDSHILTRLDIDSDILILDKAFAVLPPRVTGIKMEGVSYYEGYHTKKFYLPNSPDFALDDLLTAEVQPSGDVVVWSDYFPKEMYPYGINGVILQSLWNKLQAAAKK